MAGISAQENLQADVRRLIKASPLSEEEVGFGAGISNHTLKTALYGHPSKMTTLVAGQIVRALGNRLTWSFDPI